MSSEIHKYIKEDLNKNDNLFNSEIIKFPGDKKIHNTENLKKKISYSVWRITDKSNNDQQKALIGLCFMFVALTLVGLYSNLV